MKNILHGAVNRPAPAAKNVPNDSVFSCLNAIFAIAFQKENYLSLIIKRKKYSFDCEGSADKLLNLTAR